MSRGLSRTMLFAASIAAVALAAACQTPPADLSGIDSTVTPPADVSGMDSTVVTVRVTNPDGSAATAESMDAVRDSLTRRLPGTGFANAKVAVDGSRLRVSVGGGHSDREINLLLASGQLRFRKVIDSTADLRVVPPGDPSGGSGRSGAGATAPGPLPQRTAVLAKLGAAATVAAAVTDPSQLDATTMQRLEPFRMLTPAEVAVLPVAMQFAVPQVTCEKLNNRPPGVIDDPTVQVVACETYGNGKYLLDRAKLTGADVADASASFGGDNTGWKVDLVFTAGGARKWTDLTAEAFGNVGGACRATSPSANGSGTVCQVAIVSDNAVVSAPPSRRSSVRPARSRGASANRSPS